MLAEGTAVNDSFKEPINATSAQISELQKKIEAMPLTDADKAQMKKISDLRKSVIELRTKARDAKAAGNPDEALQIMNTQYLPAMAAYIGAQKEMVELQKKQLNEAKEDHRAPPWHQQFGHHGGAGGHCLSDLRGHRLVGALDP